MTTHSAGYQGQLATELIERRPDVLRAAEDELQRLRRVLGTVTHFINDPQHPYTARAALAQALQLPAPEKPHG